MTDGSLALTMIRAVISLGLVLALLIWCMRVLARRGGMGPSGRGRVPHDLIDVVARRQLAKGASVQVVKVGSRVLVLGVTDDAVSVLGRLSPEDLAADEKEDSDLTDTGDLAGILRRQGGAARLAAGLNGFTGRSERRAGRHRGRSRT